MSSVITFSQALPRAVPRLFPRLAFLKGRRIVHCLMGALFIAAAQSACAGSLAPAASPSGPVVAGVAQPLTALSNEFFVDDSFKDSLALEQAHSDWFGHSPYKVSFTAPLEKHCFDVSRVSNTNPSLGLVEKVKDTALQQEGLVAYVRETFRVSSDLASRIVKTAYREAIFSGVSPILVLAIIEKESSFQPGARSPVGAVGLMQVMAKYHAKRFSPPGKLIDLTHVETNIKVGSKILREYLDATQGNLKLALSRYSGNTKGYPVAVLDTYQRLKTETDPSAVRQ